MGGAPLQHRCQPKDYLAEYARVWNTVEGNTTFYSLPASETVERWHDAVPPEFRFSFKLPKSITHRRSLEGAESETATFLDRMAPHKKPDLPVRPVALGTHPVLRLVCHPADEVNEPWFELWRDVLAGWTSEGRRPHVFVHCPNDFHSPRLARRLHEVLASAAEVGEVPSWPGEERPAEEQLSLF